ncbi:transcription antitermination factor NusB [Clostridium felsineum]|uniref:transcription antitermination factor NusB n=1 Tax=Clostridium felsineum TaxID=36839 RepID=UPI00098CCBA6|nr:transcription antitermination factor NusB [Clostridium felsineum]MCR3760221.1 transcription antitermination factor NusB [Clostridium felsineum]URZ00564.1 Transcription antitermination protein NusB [Clostridium felsineum]URZ16375.1 Transcription antitermination protein NusB [Clostridium felsineum DSM 794]
MNRKKSREVAMKLLFEISINKNSIEATIENYKEDNEVQNLDFEYIERILRGIDENKEFIDSKIEEASNKWKINRISKINITIIRMAAYEIFFEKDIPCKVSANEAVELAKNYAEENSFSFVNGIIGNLINSNGEKS